MRFLKYLVLLITSLFSVQAFAYYYTLATSLGNLGSTQFPSPAAACKAYADYTRYTNPTVTSDGVGSYKYNCNVKMKWAIPPKLVLLNVATRLNVPYLVIPCPLILNPIHRFLFVYVNKILMVLLCL